MNYEEEKSYGLSLLAVSIVVCIVLMLIVWYQGIFARIKDMDAFERKEIVIADYYFEYSSHRTGEVLHLIAENGKQYMAYPSDDDNIDQGFFNENVKRNETLTIYILTDTFDVYGIQDEEHVYLDVHKAVHENTDALTCILIIGLGVGVIYLGYVWRRARRK